MPTRRGNRNHAIWGAVALWVLAFGAHLGVMIYAAVERTNVTRSYPLSRPVVGVNPLTGYIETTGIVTNFSTLKAVDVVIGFTAVGASLYLILGIAYGFNTEWARDTYERGCNGIRLLFTGVVVSLIHLNVFYLMGISDEFSLIAFFGLIFVAHSFLYASEVVGGRTKDVQYSSVGKRSGSGYDVMKIAFSIGLALTAFIPIIFAYVNAYIVFEDVSKTNMRDHLYVYAIVPFVMLVADVFWTLLLGGRCLRPGMLYEFGHFLTLAASTITVAVLIVYHSDDF